jgi:twitching motility protein PilT
VAEGPTKRTTRDRALAGASVPVPEDAGERSARLKPTEPTAPEAPLDGAELRELEKLFQLMVKYGASDLHIKAGNPPIMRIQGKIRFFDAEALSGDRIRDMLLEILSPAQRAAFDTGQDLDFAYSLRGIGRYRMNAFRQRGSVSVAVRRVNTEVPSFEELNLAAETMRKIASFRQGLVIVAGITGSGKSTTLAAMVEYINSVRRCHIVTIEDPIEYLYQDKKAFINQREIGIDIPTFADALKSVVRQDPDVILIGEMRDHETFETALTAAETGHLVFGTLHSSTVSQTFGRIIDLFPSDREKQLRQSLRFSLKAIVCQKILPSSKEGVGLVPCQEILIINATAQKLIADGEDKKIEQVIRGGKEDGMIDFNQSLVQLVKAGLISEKVATEASHNPDQLAMNLKGIFLGDDRKIVNS